MINESHANTAHARRFGHVGQIGVQAEEIGRVRQIARVRLVLHNKSFSNPNNVRTALSKKTARSLKINQNITM